MHDRIKDYGFSTIAATGNNLSLRDSIHMEVSGGYGNLTENEVHILIRSKTGDFAQGWFNVDEITEAINKAKNVPSEIDDLKAQLNSARMEVLYWKQKVGTK